MLKLNAKKITMKLSIITISLIVISFQLSAQTNKKNLSSDIDSSKNIKASELKVSELKQVKIVPIKERMSPNSSKNSSKSEESENKTILKPEQ
jgi:hypothetical protein